MENYIVIKSFFKADEKKDYNVGDIVELSKDDAERFLRNELVEKQKSVKAKK
ncbi:hypothetical protein UFOVP638_11 [uncultured Caudovirales phage]|uniref:Uncharacterized protein n=1 Tax=uncultured Caudovirales phage TaxID=2100421 RepID=A0A6J5N4B6_9CAUD|nr:hypothetical protein UFOVP638_11 [uncultured Caudovirales phage]